MILEHGNNLIGFGTPQLVELSAMPCFIPDSVAALISDAQDHRLEFYTSGFA